MRRLLSLSFVILLVGALAAPVGADDGFVLIGGDGAYAEFQVGDCVAAVGYMNAIAVKYFDGPLAKPHEDVDVWLRGDCGDETGLNLQVTQNISGVGGVPNANIERLAWAELDDFEVYDEETLFATVDLTWTAVGEAYNRVDRGEGTRAHNRLRDATVVGEVVVLGITFTAGDLVYAQMTHVNSVQRNSLP